MNKYFRDDRKINPTAISLKSKSENDESKIEEFIIEDMPTGDITTDNTISDITSIRAEMIAAEDFIFCGEQFIPFCFPKNCNIKNPTGFRWNFFFIDSATSQSKPPAL